MSSGQHHEQLHRHAVAEMPSDRSFGIVLAVFLALVGVSPRLLHGRPIRLWAVVAAGVVLLSALVVPKIIHPVTVAAMKFSAVAAKVTNPIMLALLYAVVFVPGGIVARIAGKDPLRLKQRPEDTSYWVHRESHAAGGRSMLNQF